jgi:hypothetical protein
VNFQIQNFYNGITNQIDCDVTSVSVEDGKASVIVNISTPDLEKIAEILKGKLTPEEIEANNKRDAMQAHAEGMPKKFAKLVPAFKKYVDEIWGTED